MRNICSSIDLSPSTATIEGTLSSDVGPPRANCGYGSSWLGLATERDRKVGIES